jgi:anti-anti-sigma factor
MELADLAPGEAAEMNEKDLLAVTERDGVVVASFRGDLVDRKKVADLVGAFGRLACASQTTVVLDCSQARHIGSPALKPILRLHKVLKRRGGGLALCTLSPELAEVYRITRLDRFVPVHGSLDAALAAVSPHTSAPVPSCAHCPWPVEGKCLLCGTAFCEDHGSPYSRLCRRHRWVGWVAALLFIAGMVLLRRLLPF